MIFPRPTSEVAPFQRKTRRSRSTRGCSPQALAWPQFGWLLCSQASPQPHASSATQLLQGRGPSEICSSLSLLRGCRGVQPFCTSRQSSRQALWDNGIWHSWTEGEKLGIFYSLSFELNYSAAQFRHKSVYLHCRRGKVILKEHRYIRI